MKDGLIMAGSWRTENGTEGGKDGDKTLEPKGPKGGPEVHLSHQMSNKSKFMVRV